MKSIYEKNTDELFNNIKENSDVEKFLEDNQHEFSKPLHEYLKELLAKKNLTKKILHKALNCEPSHIYHIFSGKKKPSRPRLLAIARAMNLNLEETQYLLRYGGYGILYSRNTWDAVIISAIEQNFSIDVTDQFLSHLKTEPILNPKLAVNR